LVTPSSQIVGTQAVFNVIMGPYKVMTAEFADLMLGYYGFTLGAKDPEVVALAKAQTGKEIITGRPADLIADEWDALAAQGVDIEGFDGTDEDVLTLAMFPKVAPGFFASRPQGPKNVGRDPGELAAQRAGAAGDSGSGPVRGPVKYEITVNGKKHSVAVKPG
jgi:methylmalonyl-CoA carboxyltransferase 5S subunit